MTAFPNLAGVATDDLVESIGSNNFKASYINWSRTMHLLRTHAPGWLPELMQTESGSIIHRAPVGAFLLIRFVDTDGKATPPVPQAIMDSRNAAVPFDKVTARDVTDTHRRGVCMAAALTFGLAYELWAKIPLESGYADQAEPEPQPVAAGKPMDGVWDSLDADQQAGIRKLAAEVQELRDAAAAHALIERQKLATEEKAALWSLLPSNVRSALKKAAEAAKEKASE